MLKSRKKISKVFAVGLIAVMLCTALCGVSFATSWTYSDETKVFGSSTFDNRLWQLLYAYIENEVDIDDYYSCLICYDPSSPNNGVGYMCVALFSDDIIDCGGIGQVYTEYPDSTGVYFAITNYSYSPYKYSYSSSSRVSENKYLYTPLAGGSWTSPAFNYGYTWCSSSLRGLTPNLLFRDLRTLDVSPVTYYDTDYLSVTCNVDLIGHGSLFTVSYTDTQGSYTYGFQSYQYIDFTAYSDVHTQETYSTFKVNISSIPTTGAFTLTGATLDTATLWGSKSVTFAYSYGGDGISLPPNYTDVTYFNNFYESDYSGSIGATFLGTLYFGVYDNGTAFYLRDSEDYLVQNFDVKFIALPNYLWATTGSDLRQWNLEEYYELFEMYDVVILGLGEEAFDELYGVGKYSAWSQLTVSQVINLIEKSTPEYKSCPFDLLESNLSDFDFSFYWSNIGFIVTRNYLLKRTFYALGDVDSRLLDFETKLLGESGTLTAIETKLITGLTQDNTFYNKVEDFMVGLTAFYNNLLVEDWFNKVSGYLSDIKDALLNSFEPLQDLEEPFLPIYRFFTGALSDVLDLLPDFQNFADKAVNPDVLCFPTPVPTVPLIPTLGGGYDVVPY